MWETTYLRLGRELTTKMSGSVRLMFTILAVVFVGYFVVKIVSALLASVVHALLSLIVPLAIVGVVALALYTVINRRALGPGRRLLP
jgi:uncharacterized membrane-anchored protein